MKALLRLLARLGDAVMRPHPTSLWQSSSYDKKKNR